MKRIKVRSDRRLFLGVLQVAAVLLLLAGCGGSKGPVRYDLSGKVTYRGAAVPHGLIFFMPDRVKGNDGPPVSVPIVNGEYKTMPGQGTTGGSYVAIISSFESDLVRSVRQRKRFAKPLFPQVQMSIDLPMQNSTHDFVIPEETGDAAPAP